LLFSLLHTSDKSKGKETKNQSNGKGSAAKDTGKGSTAKDVKDDNPKKRNSKKS
jgi:hypothetical protein